MNLALAQNVNLIELTEIRAISSVCQTDRVDWAGREADSSSSYHGKHGVHFSEKEIAHARTLSFFFYPVFGSRDFKREVMDGLSNPCLVKKLDPFNRHFLIYPSEVENMGR